MPLVTKAEPRDSPNHKFRGCSSILDYEVLGKLGEGTFGEVHKARSKRTGAVYALKKILMHNEKDGFPITALREIKILKSLKHHNILELTEMAIERNKLKEPRKKALMYMVTPYMDHDLSGLLENPDVKFSEAQIKCYMLQLLEGLKFLHTSHILHRDMKAANLLINNKGILQIADFGLARYFDESSPKPGRGAGEARRDYTALVVTRWYRPPELLLGLRKYTCAIDMWGVGCVFAEMFRRKPILRGDSDAHQLQIIFELVGTPTDENMPGWSTLPGAEGVKSFGNGPRGGKLVSDYKDLSKEAISLLSSLMRLDWRIRLTAIDALQHPYFTTDPLPAKPHELPTYAHSHEFDRRKFRDQKNRELPPAPAGGAVGMGPGHSFESGPDSRNGAGWGSRPPSHDPRYSGPPPRDYDRRGPPPSYDSRGPPPGARPPAAKPGWARDREDRPARDWERDRDRDCGPNGRPSGLPPVREPPGRSGVDTYIPDYAGSETSARPPPRDGRLHYRDRDRDRDAYDRRDRERDRDYYSRDRDRERDWDRDWDRRREEDRDRHSDRGRTASGPPESRRTRSRSPDRQNGGRERDRNTELYRR